MDEKVVCKVIGDGEFQVTVNAVPPRPLSQVRWQLFPQTTDGADSALLPPQVPGTETGCIPARTWVSPHHSLVARNISMQPKCRAEGEHNSFCLFSSLLPKSIYHRNACHARAGEQGGLSLKSSFEPIHLRHRLPTSWEFVTDTMTPQKLGLSGHTSATASCGLGLSQVRSFI